ncbi:hypothetical protein JCM19992_17100 [Thermostilla marina]
MRFLTAVLVGLGGVCLAAGDAAAQPSTRLGQPAVMRVLDADGNGVISAGELATAGESLKKLDADGNGEISPAELFGGRRRGPGVLPSVGSGSNSLEKPPLPKDDFEQRVLGVLKDMDENQRAGNMNVPLNDGRLLRLLVEAIDAKNVVEIGTSNGFSGTWMALALKRTGGKLTTFEIDHQRAELARKNFARAGVADIVTLIEGDAHEEVTKLKGPIDLVFIDADKPGYPDYLTKLLPLVRPGGLIIGHNMNRPAPDPKYIEMITTNPELETLFFHMSDAGIAVSLKKR